MKSILLEFILNLFNFHWWIWIALMAWLGGLGADDLDEASLGAAFTVGGGGFFGILLFERWVGSAKSFGLVDALSAILMCVIVWRLFQSWQKVKESAAKKVANKQEGKNESTTSTANYLGEWKDGKFLGKPAVKKVAQKSASSPATTQRLSSDSAASKATKPIREINRYSTSNPSTSSSVSSSTREKLEELKSLLDDGLINEKDYETKKNDLLRKM